MIRTLAAVALALLSIGLLGESQASAEDNLTVTVVSAEDPNFPTTTVIVLAELAGRPISELTPAQVSVTDNGVAGTVASVALLRDTNLSANVVLAVDVSGSMLGEKLAQAKTALASLVGNLGAQDAVALISFADRPQLVTPFSVDKATVRQSISALSAGGNTALYGAVAESVRVASAPGIERQVVVLLTDGEEFGNLSGVTRADSLDRARQSGALFFVIGLGEADQGYLRELAAATGGRYVHAASSGDVQAGFQAISEALKGQFAITFLSGAPASPQERRIAVKLTSGASTGEATYSFRSQRTAPTALPATATLPAAPTIPPATAAASPTPMPAADTGGSSASPAVVLASVLAAGIIAAAGIGIAKRRRPAQSAAAPEALTLPPGNQPRAAPVVVSPALLIPVRGAAELLRIGEVPLPLDPVNIGSGADVFLRLPAGPGVSAHHARLWWRDGTAMLHHVGDTGVTKVNGGEISWVSLSDGDVIEIAQFAFQLKLRAAP